MRSTICTIASRSPGPDRTAVLPALMHAPAELAELRALLLAGEICDVHRG